MTMKTLTLRTVRDITGGEYIGDPEFLDHSISSVVRDHREVIKDSLFLCFPGERVDGHDYADAACAAGSIACLAEKSLPLTGKPYVLVPSTFEAVKSLAMYYRSLFSIPIIGITGSAGKTTTKEMIAAVLSRKFRVHKTTANYNNELGSSLTLLSMDEDTEIAVVEMGINRFGEMDQIARMVQPTACVFTNVGRSHLEFLGSPEGVLRAKSEIFSHMDRSAQVFLNGDDALLARLSLPNPVILYGLKDTNHVFATDIVNPGVNELNFVMHHDGLSIPVSMPAYGHCLAIAAMAAAAVGREFGLTDAEIVEGLRHYRSIGGRSAIVRTKNITIIDDSYNANPNSVEAGIESLADLPGRHVAILGDMKELGGSQEIALHKEVGEYAAAHGVDVLLCCGDNARYIHEGACQCQQEPAPHHEPVESHFYDNKPDLYDEFPGLLRQGDVVLVKASNSMRFFEIVDKIREWSDRFF